MRSATAATKTDTAQTAAATATGGTMVGFHKVRIINELNDCVVCFLRGCDGNLLCCCETPPLFPHSTYV